MIISDTAVRQRVSVMVLCVILFIFGSYSYMAMPRESSPDISIPYVFVSTDYKGVSPADIELSVTIPIEKKLKGLEGVKKISSVSAEGLSSINIEFVTGTDIDTALEKVRNKVDEARKDLPNDLEEDPSVFEVNFSEMPIVVYSLAGTCGNPCLKKIAEDLKDDIEAVPGVLEVELAGGLEREIRVEVIPERLAAYGIPITSVQSVVGSENQNTSGGAVRLGDGRFQLRVPGEFKTPDEIYGLVVGTHGSQPVYLKDVARVIDGFKDETSRSRINGRESVSLSVKKRAGENIIAIADKVDEIIAMRTASWPRGTEIIKNMDQAKDIRAMVADLENNILSGLVLVVLVIMFAMGFRNAVLVSLAIPFSMFMSFMTLHSMGITLNMVVLFSLTLAMGTFVDDAVVIIENIYRFMQQGVPRTEACMRATSEVAYPVIGSTLTTLVAFFPLLFWPGIMGEFMKYLPLTVIVMLMSSLTVALVINPALGSYFIRIRGKVAVPASVEEIQRAGERPIEIKGPILQGYTMILRGALNHSIAVILMGIFVTALFFEIWLLVIGIEKPVEFFPDIDPKAMYVNLDLPEGADMDYADNIVKRIEMRVAGAVNTPGSGGGLEGYAQALAPKRHRDSNGKEFDGPSDIQTIDSVYARTMVGAVGGSSFTPNTPTHLGIQFIDFDRRPVSTNLALEEIRRRVEDIPGAKITVEKGEEGPPTGAPINIEISGDDVRVLGQIARKVREIVARVPFVKDVRDDYVEGTPSVRVTVDRQKAALFGLTTDAIGYALKAGYNGLNVSTYREKDEDFDITIQLSDPERRKADVLYELMIPTPSGELVPLTTIARIDYEGGLGEITRINNQRVVTVKASVNEQMVPGPVARAEAEKLLTEFPIPSGYKMQFTGELEIQKESEDFLSKAFVIGLFLIFLVMVTQFNSVVQPLIVMVTVILGFGGVFFGLIVLMAPFGIIMGGVGVISLAGVVVKNGIVLIDYTNKLRERGHGLKDALISAGATRLRPVYLTAITAILGLVPMLTGVSYDFTKGQMAWTSESSLWWRQMASINIFGLLMATMLTLVVVPCLYYLIERGRESGGRWVKWLDELYWRPWGGR